MKKFLLVLVTLIGFSFFACESESKPTYLEQNFTIDAAKDYQINEIVAGVPVQSQALDDLLKEALKLNGYSAGSTDLVNFLQSDKCRLVIDFSKSPKEYSLKVDGITICAWRHINLLKKTKHGFLAKTLEFRSFD